MDVLLSSDTFQYLFTLFSYFVSPHINTNQMPYPTDLLLSPDISKYLLSMGILRLRDILNLATVSKKLRMIALSEETWYIISDATKIFYDFINSMVKSDVYVSYPLDKIQRMNSIDKIQEMNFNGLNYPALLEIGFYFQHNRDKFYDYFTSYRYYCVHHKQHNIPNFNKSLMGIFISSSGIFERFRFHQIMMDYAITEIIAPYTIIDAEFLTRSYKQIEKLTVKTILNSEYLKQTRLKYLCVTGSIATDIIFANVPDTIESIMICDGQYESLSIESNKLPCLNYLGINVPVTELSSSLKVDTLHLVIPPLRNDIKINIPNIRNIIISRVKFTRDCKIYLKAENAVTLKILGIDKNDFRLQSYIKMITT
jgi:hypothetical protein